MAPPISTEEALTSRGMPAEDLLPIQVDNDPEHVLYISALLPKTEQHRYRVFLLTNLDAFTWSDDELLAIPPEIVSHLVVYESMWQPNC
ncbi:hypothetical protein Taro_041902 [Colocasia esculenta]|uniref:Uncharacterized protein n=1 Tax=Colocasia esculenta TaxID=4460 RepID=A0A843WH22_COLES|nr:hypothetical protein [Colocasia esculenta]